MREVKITGIKDNLDDQEVNMTCRLKSETVSEKNFRKKQIFNVPCYT